MTYPDQQAQYPGYPQQPQAPYPPAPPQPAYPPQQYPPQQYQQPAPGYPPQQAYTQPQAPPPPPAPHTTMADYLDKPSMSGASLQFDVPGTRHTGIVARDLDPKGDFPPQTERDGVTPKRFRDGRPMVRMVVPLNIRPDQRHPDGKASLNVQGQMAEALKQAMSDVGAGHLSGIPESGSEITVTFTYQMPPKQQGFSGQKIYEVIYKRPPGAAPAPQDNGQQAQEQPPWTPPAPQYAPPQQPAPPVQYQQPQPQFQAPAQPQHQQPGPPPPQAPTGMAGPAQQVAAATQAAVQAGQQYQVPALQGQPGVLNDSGGFTAHPAAMAPPPGAHPYTAALMKQATGQALTTEDQAALAAGPPQQ